MVGGHALISFFSLPPFPSRNIVYQPLSIDDNQNDDLVVGIIGEDEQELGMELEDQDREQEQQEEQLREIEDWALEEEEEEEEGEEEEEEERGGPERREKNLNVQEHWLIERSNLVLERQVGFGSYGVVYKGKWGVEGIFLSFFLFFFFSFFLFFFFSFFLFFFFSFFLFFFFSFFLFFFFSFFLFFFLSCFLIS